MAAISKFRWVAFITPPHQPYPPGLQQAGIELRHLLVVCAQAAADVSWSLEKLLRSGHCGMALAWPQRLSDHQTRRLQLATETGNALTVLFPRQASQTSHAAVRLSANPVADGLVLNILKARGRLSRESVVVRT
jgi:cell division inhibitor SulA/protein ImuA